MKVQNYSISVLIIAKNEEATIEQVVLEAINFLPKITKKYEILVNDDASTDKTSYILDGLANNNPNLKVFHQKTSLGITGGLEFLYKKAKNNLIITNSGDGQCTIKDLPNMLDKIIEGYDLVIGKRDKKDNLSIIRKIISSGFNILPQIMFGVRFYDAGSMKLYKTEVLQNTKPISKSVFSEPERIIRAYKLGYKVTYVKINYFKRKKGTSSSIRLGLIITSIIDMIKLRFMI